MNSKTKEALTCAIFMVLKTALLIMSVFLVFTIAMKSYEYLDQLTGSVFAGYSPQEGKDVYTVSEVDTLIRIAETATAVRSGLITSLSIIAVTGTYGLIKGVLLPVFRLLEKKDD